MKKYLIISFVLFSYVAHSQSYNNEWIDYSKIYYKFKIATSGLYRISQSSLSGIGMSAVPAEQFQLWRNGQEVPLYTTKSTGVFTGADYIEFWGEMNDGKPDKALYRDADFQLNDKWSLETDTASFFLTVNVGVNRRLVTTSNVLPGGTPVPEPYFIYTQGVYFKNRINSGFAQLASGELLHSSSYDLGEGYTSVDINNYNGSGAPKLTQTLSNLYPYTGSGTPSASLLVHAAGNNSRNRNLNVVLNGSQLFSVPMNFYNYVKREQNFPVSNFNVATNGTVAIEVRNTPPDTSTATDRIVVAMLELKYPRQFNFGNATNFSFKLPANASGNYLEISNFNGGGSVPVLYDFTNGKRYEAIVSGSILKFSLSPSAMERELLLVSEASSLINTVSQFERRNFVDYMQAGNQGNYMIVTHSALVGSALDAFSAYRSSATGGAYSVKRYMIDQLEDQFSYGIKMHPNAIRNFIRLAKVRFSNPIKHVFLVGKGVNYVSYRASQNTENMSKLAFVPGFGYPSSDNLFVADPGIWLPTLSIGRLSVINTGEIQTYLDKLLEYEQVQRSSSPVIVDRAWMKNMMNVSGGKTENEAYGLLSILNISKGIVSDTLMGAYVESFSKSTTSTVEPANQSRIKELIEGGIGFLNYLGHSSATTLEFDLLNSLTYNNRGKYPVYNFLGCKAGDIYSFSSARLNSKETLSENFLLASNRGGVAVVASSNFGLSGNLQNINKRMAQLMSGAMYNRTIGELMQQTWQNLYAVYPSSYSYRYHSESTNINGDPAVRLNAFSKPDYVIEAPLVSINPSVVSIASGEFKLSVKMMNIGKAEDGNIVVEVKRTYPDNSTSILQRATIPGIRYIDSLNLVVPVDAFRDRGLNKITVTLDADNAVDELYETNNSITKEIYILEDEIRPVYPADFSIINKQGILFKASTANPFSAMDTYRLDIDTTVKFNSPLKRSKEVTSKGGLIEFNPGLTFRDSTVYYWRVGKSSVPADSAYSGYSFQYISTASSGFSQAHYDQLVVDRTNGLGYNANRGLDFARYPREIAVTTGILPEFGLATQYKMTVDNVIAMTQQGVYRPDPSANENVLRFYVLDGTTLKPWVNQVNPSDANAGMYGSVKPDPATGSTIPGFYHFKMQTAAQRQTAMNFLDLIPDSTYIVFTNPPRGGTVLPKDWQADTTTLGSGKSLYHKLYNMGCTGLEQVDTYVPFVFVFRKGENTALWQEVAPNRQTLLNAVVPVLAKRFQGLIQSADYGPASSWQVMHWNGYNKESGSSDKVKVQVLGIKSNGGIDTLKTIVVANESVSLTDVDAVTYPRLRLQMTTLDSTNYTPYQLRYWMVTGAPIREGAIASDLHFLLKDTVDKGELIKLSVAFKNVEDKPFDSLKVKVVITDRNNVPTEIPIKRLRPMQGYPDSVQLHVDISTENMVGTNLLLVDINPDKDQTEQQYFNNFFYKEIVVRGDTLSPLLDVTFDGVHILNKDIVSSKPHILVKLEDEAKWLSLNDTSLVIVQIKYPNGQLRRIYFNNDTLRFTPAGQAPNTTNVATVDYLPYFTEDGEYELIVSGRDRSDNKAGRLDYRVAFRVINKAMISNMLNYPNPFTSSTAFVFTITGSEVPQNIRIQILTITGKVVRDITKEELGTLRIGRNITEFKWDGTDQYGQKLANGVYLYRVITNHQGKSLEKFKDSGDNTDQYFNKGYGKMYLMR